MIKKAISLFILFYLNLGVSALSAKDLDPLEVIEENLLLEAEFQLARSSKPYFLINLKDKKISLKIRGMVFSEWEFAAMHFFGYPLPPKSIPLIEKTTLFPPSRKHIKPSQNKDQTDIRIDALEVDDMPDRYTLFLDERIRIYVRPKATGLFSIFGNLGDSVEWFTTPPLLSIWYAFSKKSFTAISITLRTQHEARTLYWSFTEGTLCILLPQSHLLLPPTKGGKHLGEMNTTHQGDL